jgi:serine acetyltransferase
MVEPTKRGDPAVDAHSPVQARKEWNDPNPNRAIPFWASIRQDIVAHLPLDQRAGSALSWAVRVAKIGVTSPGFKVTLLYRVNHVLVHRTGLAGKVVAGVVNRATHLVYGSAIAPRARLHGGLILPHPQGIIIGSEVVVGPRTWIYQNVTMGGTDGKDGEPTVGADCRIYTGAVIGGPVTIGDEVVVSPNSLVQRSVPSRSMAVGVPANIFPKFAKPKAG